MEGKKSSLTKEERTIVVEKHAKLLRRLFIGTFLRRSSYDQIVGINFTDFTS